MTARIDVQEQAAKAALNTPGGDELMEKVGGKGDGLPFIAFLDAKGGLIVNSMRPVPGKAPANIGHPIEPFEVDWFMAMVHKAAPGISEEEAKVFETWLRTQKK